MKTIANVQFDSFVLKGLEARLAIASLEALEAAKKGDGQFLTELFSMQGAQIDTSQMKALKRISKIPQGKKFIGKLIESYGNMSQEEIEENKGVISQIIAEFIDQEIEDDSVEKAMKVVRAEKDFLTYSFQALKKTTDELQIFIENMKKGDVDELAKSIASEEENGMDFSFYEEDEEKNTTPFISTPSLEPQQEKSKTTLPFNLSSSQQEITSTLT